MHETRETLHARVWLLQTDMQSAEVETCCRQAVERFHTVFGRNDKPTIGVFAPGRVNLIGEHTDYNGGCVLPMALHLVTVIIGRPSPSATPSPSPSPSPSSTPTPIPEGICRLATCATSSSITGQNNYCEFPVPKCPPAGDEYIDTGDPEWARYVKGVVALMNSGGRVPPFDAVIATTVPLGGGVSSSASLEVAACLFVEKLVLASPERPLSFTDEEKKERALLCQKAEHRFAGMPCGIMDQFVCFMAQEKHALFIDCSNQEANHVPLSNPDLVVLVTNSNYKHSLVDGEYAQRRAGCFSAAQKLGKELLKDATQEELEAQKDQLTEDEYRYARHVVGEICRTREAVDVLRTEDYQKFGELMNQSHDSLRDDYRVSCDELDQLVDLARQDKEGVYGSRMTGGGFGGCTVTLLHRSAVERTKRRIKDNYKSREQKEATFYVATPSAGAGEITSEQLQSCLQRSNKTDGSGMGIGFPVLALLVPVVAAIAAYLIYAYRF